MLIRLHCSLNYVAALPVTAAAAAAGLPLRQQVCQGSWHA
jgi:hypothetical protein